MEFVFRTRIGGNDDFVDTIIIKISNYGPRSASTCISKSYNNRIPCFVIACMLNYMKHWWLPISFNFISCQQNEFHLIIVIYIMYRNHLSGLLNINIRIKP